jgi:hypothetical protein
LRVVCVLLGGLFPRREHEGQGIYRGVLSFLTAHVFYVAAYIKSPRAISGCCAVAGWEVAAALAGLAALIVVAVVRKMQFGEFKIPILIYSASCDQARQSGFPRYSSVFRRRGCHTCGDPVNRGRVLFVLSDACSR